MKYYSVETFNIGHTLVTNKLPQAASLGIYVDIPEKAKSLDVSKFGLFDCSTPDFNTYYPDVTPDDLTPKDEEFSFSVWRALSAIIINKYGPIDFTKPGVLKKSTNLLVGQAMMTNHDQVIGAEVGVVIEAVYEREKQYEGYTLPAGINIKIKLDGKSNPKLVRSVMMDPPSVHSISVTVAFKWDQSHTDMPADEFWNKLGTYDADGKLISRVVTEIIRYDEVSFVTHGADPFAQKIVDGTIVNPEYAKRVYQFSADNKERHIHFIDWKNFDFSKVSLSETSTIPPESKITNPIENLVNETSKSMKPELLAFLITQFGLLPAASETEVIAKIQNELPSLIAKGGQLASLQTQLTAAQGEVAGFKEKYPEGTKILGKEDEEKLQKYNAMDMVMVKVMTSTQQEALRLYHLSVGGAGKADPSITKMISEANFDTLTALAKQYSAVVEKTFVATCNDCKSTNITRASSINPESGIATDDSAGSGKGTGAKSVNDISQELYEKHTGGSKAGFVHGTKK